METRVTLFLSLVFLAGSALAEGPRFRHRDPVISQEFDNVYRDLRSAKFSSGTYIQNSSTLQSGATFYVSTGTATDFTTSTASISNIDTNVFMGNHLLTGLLAGSAAGHSARFDQFKILQVVTSSSTTNFTTTSTSYVSTNLNGNITPSLATSKILIFAVGTCGNTTSAGVSNYTLTRATTNLASANGLVRTYSDSDANVPCAMVFLDSPATTSNTTYRVQMKVASNTGYFAFDVDQTMILLEVNGL